MVAETLYLSAMDAWVLDRATRADFAANDLLRALPRAPGSSSKCAAPKCADEAAERLQPMKSSVNFDDPDDLGWFNQEDKQ